MVQIALSNRQYETSFQGLVKALETMEYLSDKEKRGHLWNSRFRHCVYSIEHNDTVYTVPTSAPQSV